ncbi:MAG TPA: 5-formyltetrahydrofolate cyclo-ligase [Burkholderiales bacterium]|nr:5-formyltetrahydrofolate cyclo-ligase [Burkholderiales bacterium]
MSPPDDLVTWRKSQRTALIADRLALSDDAQVAMRKAIAQHLDAVRVALHGAVIGFCWPYRGEPDLTDLIESWRNDGIVATLPEPLEAQRAVRFRRWSPDVRMIHGAYGIPVPEGTEVLTPDLILAPLVGFDDRGYRLGYGGGYFDRLIADIVPAPVAIGVGLEQARLNTIFPQPHDAPMDYIVTEAGIRVVEPQGLRELSGEQVVEHLRLLLASRHLPRLQSMTRIELSSPVCYADEFPGYFGDSEASKEK